MCPSSHDDYDRERDDGPDTTEQDAQADRADERRWDVPER